MKQRERSCTIFLGNRLVRERGNGYPVFGDLEFPGRSALLGAVLLGPPVPCPWPVLYSTVHTPKVNLSSWVVLPNMIQTVFILGMPFNPSALNEWRWIPYNNMLSRVYFVIMFSLGFLYLILFY